MNLTSTILINRKAANILEFTSVEHEQAFNNVLDVADERSEYFVDDPRFSAMIYILTSDFLVSKFDRITNDTNEIFEIDYSLKNVVLSSTEKFMMTFALKFYFSSVECDYDFAYWYSQLDRENQDVILNSLKFIRN